LNHASLKIGRAAPLLGQPRFYLLKLRRISNRNTAGIV
jgi:hypothetical protein